MIEVPPENSANQQLEYLLSEFLRCKPWIEAALKHAGKTHEVSDVLDQILAGNLQLWPGESSVVVTEINTYPQRRTMNYFLAGGNLKELQRMVPDLEKWAISVGCSGVTLTGRKGWLRSFLKDSGYSEVWVVMAKELSNGQG